MGAGGRPGSQGRPAGVAAMMLGHPLDAVLAPAALRSQGDGAVRARSRPRRPPVCAGVRTGGPARHRPRRRWAHPSRPPSPRGAALRAGGPAPLARLGASGLLAAGREVWVHFLALDAHFHCIAAALLVRIGAVLIILAGWASYRPSWRCRRHRSGESRSAFWSATCRSCTGGPPSPGSPFAWGPRSGRGRPWRPALAILFTSYGASGRSRRWRGARRGRRGALGARDERELGAFRD